MTENFSNFQHVKTEDQQEMWRFSVKIVFLSVKNLKSTLAG